MGQQRRRHGASDLPVDHVDWFDCQQFCELLCQRLGRVFRLPSEAEWEYACRAGTTTRYSFGNFPDEAFANFTHCHPMRGDCGPLPQEEPFVPGIQQLINIAKSDESGRRFRTTPVGSYPPNPWGLYDMHGNVNEWCEDVWHDSYDGAPTDGSPWLEGMEQQPCRVLRGGYCSANPLHCTSSARRSLRPDGGSRTEDVRQNPSEDARILTIIREMTSPPYGFRVVCEV